RGPRRGSRRAWRAADVPVRGDADRSDRVHDRHAAADGGGTDGGMAARAPRDKDRPERRAARGIAVNGSDPSAMGVTMAQFRASGGLAAAATSKAGGSHPTDDHGFATT